MESFRLGTIRTLRLCQAPRQSSSSSVCLLHNSARSAAAALPHPTIVAKPPAAPIAVGTSLDDRLSRKRRQAELLREGKELRANLNRPSSALRKRFWKQVHVKEVPNGLQVLLDTRPVRTASKEVLVVPHYKRQLATAIALEWDHLINAQQALKQHYVPLTSLVSRAVDIQNADQNGNSKIRDDIVRMAMRYLHTDTLLCWVGENDIYERMRNEHGETLREMQVKVAQPLIDFMITRVWPGIEIQPVLAADSIVPTAQPEMTQQVIRGWVSGLPAFELAALERAVLASKSLLVAARLIVEWSAEFSEVGASSEANSRFGIEDAAYACSLEVRWQTDMWGEVEDTHDVDKEDLRRQLGAAILLISGES